MSPNRLNTLFIVALIAIAAASAMMPRITQAANKTIAVKIVGQDVMDHCSTQWQRITIEYYNAPKGSSVTLVQEDASRQSDVTYVVIHFVTKVSGTGYVSYDMQVPANAYFTANLGLPDGQTLIQAHKQFVCAQ